MKTFTSRHLPHYQPPDATYSIVFRLAGSLPVAVVQRLQEERLREERRIAGVVDKAKRVKEAREFHDVYFRSFDHELHAQTTGRQWLRSPAVATIVAEALHYRDQRQYELLAYCIMPNHVHLIARPLCPREMDVRQRDPSTYMLTDILENLK